MRKCILILSALVFSCLSLANDFKGIYPTESYPDKNCIPLSFYPVSKLGVNNSFEIKDLLISMDSAKQDLEKEAFSKGMNAIIGYRSNYQISVIGNRAIIAYELNGVAVNLRCTK